MTPVFYTMQGERGEDPASPNVTFVASPPASATLRHVKRAFPLALENAPSEKRQGAPRTAFAFRFKTTVGSPMEDES